MMLNLQSDRELPESTFSTLGMKMKLVRLNML